VGQIRNSQALIRQRTGPTSQSPNATAVVASSAINVGDPTGWFGERALAAIGPTRSPGTAHSVRRRPASSMVVSLCIRHGWSTRLMHVNVFNTKTNQ